MSVIFLGFPLSFFGVSFRLVFGAELLWFFDEHVVEEVRAGCQEPINENHIDYLLNRRELRHIHKGNVNRISILLCASLLDGLVK